MVYKILLVEDEATMRRLMSTLLRRQNHEVIEATNGEEAFTLACEHQPDVILLDVMMPVIDGFATLRRLRAHRETEDIPVIFLSAKSQVEDRVEGLRLGADDYLIKPAEPAELLARISAVILRSRRSARLIKGTVFGFIGVKGGVGTTTAVANLGVYFQKMGRSPLLIDLNLTFGNLAVQFGFNALEHSIANLTLLPSSEIDLDTVSRYVLRHESGIQLLPSPPDAPTWANPAPGILKSVIEQAAFLSRHIFIDLPRNPTILEAIADHLNGVVLVLGGEPASLRSAEELGSYLNNIGMYHRLSALIVHRSNTEFQIIDANMVANQLRCLVLGTIPYKPDAYLRADYKQSPVLLAPESSSDELLFEKIGGRLLSYVETLEQFHKQRIYQDRRLA